MTFTANDPNTPAVEPSILPIPESSSPTNTSETKKLPEPLGFSDLMGTDMVTLTVGTRKEVFKVHRKILCDRISYFDKMFRGPFQEALTSTATFPEDDPKMFSLLLRWVYDGTIPSVTWVKIKDNAESANGWADEKDDQDKYDYDEWDHDWNPLRLHILADKLNVIEVMDRTFDEYIWGFKLNNIQPGDSMYRFAYTSSPEGSLIRKFHAKYFAYDMVVCTRGTNGLQDLLDEFVDLARDMVPYLRGTNMSEMLSPVAKFPHCEYHSHLKADVCPWKDLGTTKVKSEELARVWG